MTGFQGMDTAGASDLASLVSERARSFETILEELTSRIDAIVGTSWIGPDAEAFLASFRGSTQPQLTAAISDLHSRREQLLQNIEEQEDASDADALGGAIGAGLGAGIGGAPGIGGGLAPMTPPSPVSAGFLGADWGDISFGEFWDNWKENVGIDGVDASGGLISGVHSFAKNFGEFALGKGSVPAFIPMIGDAFTGVMAGVDRWNDDADRTDLSIGERLGRAVLDGGASFGGSLAGSAVGGYLGGTLGAGVVGLFGGGAGAVAGAPAAGVGAVPGAAAGATGGVAAGAVVGGIVGDVVGSYFGATTADALVDSFLD